MELFNIYSEGYSATGENGVATYHGSMLANSFEEAVTSFAEGNEDFKHYFNRKYMTYWGCKLYPTLEEARKTFG